MTDAIPIIDNSSEGLYPIRTVAELTGVNAITLRAWENRYGLIEPTRKKSGHRLYSQEDIDLINKVVGFLDRGMRIGQVQAYMESEQAAIEEPADDQERIGDTWRRYLDGMLAGIIRFDEEALESVYNEALSHYPIKTVTAKLLTPLLIELGRRWETSMGTVAEEHFFGFYLRNKLGARFHHRVRHNSGPKLLMACLPGERHEIGLLMFALAANETGYRTIILGSDMPLREMAPAAGKTECDAIILSGVLEPTAGILKTELPELASDTNVPVFVGGKVSVKVFDALKRMGVEPLGIDVETGLRRLEEIVPAGS